MLKIKLFIFLIFFAIAFQVSAQQSVNSSGGDATGSGGSASYSLGQVVYSSNSTATGTISQGVQQAHEIYALGIDNEKQDLILNLYPNPTSQFITLDINTSDLQNYSVQLTDIHGKQILEIENLQNKTEMNLNNLPTASYYLILMKGKSVIETYKIVKL
jgi:hypothetical protein